jgi:hypothetical protein
MKMKYILQSCIFRNTKSIVLLLVGICLINWSGNASANDLNSFFKGLGQAIQQNAQGQRDAGNSGPSVDTQNQGMNSEDRARKSFLATKTPPTSTNWTKIYNQSVTFYYDPALIRQDGMYVTIPYLVDRTWPDEIDPLTTQKGRFLYKSVISVVQLDCSRRSPPPRSERFWRNQDHFFFPENMAQGDAMMNPSRSTDPKWIEGMEFTGMKYQTVNQSYFIFKVLDLELKICTNYWKRPDGWAPPKTPPYLQKQTTSACEGNDMSKWRNCNASINRGLPNNPWQSRVFNNPGRYEGPVTNGAPNGWGTYTFEGGDRAGDIYIGFFRYGSFEGFGTYYHNAPNNLQGSIYIGQFEKHLKHGLGTYIYGDGRPIEEGIWKEGKLVEPVTLKEVFFDTRMGLPFCQGTDATQWTNCFGYFEFDPIVGQVLQKSMDTAYAGSFKNGLPDGVGSYFSNTRSIFYQGELKQGGYEGKGTLFIGLVGLSFYKGGFVDGNRQGKGVFQSKGKHFIERREGEWMKGSLTMGTWYKQNEFTYVGSFLSGLFHGEGTFTPERKPGGGEPIVQKGFWEKGKLLTSGDKGMKKQK